jgi:hypothetical protein
VLAWCRGARTSPLPAKVDCATQKAELECTLELERLRLDAQEAADERKRRLKDREEEKAQRKAELIVREENYRARREEDAKRRSERRAAWKQRWGTLPGEPGTLRVFLILVLPATLALFLYSQTFATPAPAEVDATAGAVATAASSGSSGEVLAIGLLTAVAAFVVGALLGFLFGIPRSIAAKQGTTADGAATEGTTGTAPSIERKFKANSNLEEISDWLTKILIGVGLVQIHQASGAIEDLSEGLAPGLGSQGFTVAVVLLVSFSVIGFICSYMFTRLRLQSLFEASLGDLPGYIRDVVLQQARTETDATALIQKQLSPGEIDRPSQEELVGALKAATSGVRSNAFYSAREQRRKNWQGRSEAGEDKDYVAPTIGVFTALIACDEEGHYFRTRAEWGYALKDQKNADYPGAKAALDKAIELRPNADANQSGMYEFNRAYCNIKLDPNLGRQTTEEAARPIVSDLEAARRSSDAAQITAKELAGEGADSTKSVQNWLRDNKGLPGVKGLK